MTLALRFCLFLAIGSTAVSLLSMATIELFDHFSPSGGSRWDVISEIGDWIVCVFYIGGSMGTLAWLKIWVANPSFNSGEFCLIEIRANDRLFHGRYDPLHCRYQGRSLAEITRDCPHRIHWMYVHRQLS